MNAEINLKYIYFCIYSFILMSFFVLHTLGPIERLCKTLRFLMRKTESCF